MIFCRKVYSGLLPFGDGRIRADYPSHERGGESVHRLQAGGFTPMP